VDTRRRVLRTRMTVAAAAVLASGWALWLMRDRPALAAALGLFCLALLFIGLRRPAASIAGVLQVDDLGRPFWCASHAASKHSPFTANLDRSGVRGVVISKWQRSERSAWLRLLPEPSQSQSASPSERIDLAVYSSDTSPEAWAALQRWLVWLERGQVR